MTDLNRTGQGGDSLRTRLRDSSRQEGSRAALAVSPGSRSISTDQIVAHVSSIIDRHQLDLDELMATKPRPTRQISLSKERLTELRSFRHDILNGRRPDRRIMDSIIEEMSYIGW